MDVCSVTFRTAKQPDDLPTNHSDKRVHREVTLRIIRNLLYGLTIERMSVGAKTSKGVELKLVRGGKNYFGPPERFPPSLA